MGTKMRSGEQYAGGLALNFFESAEFEAEKPNEIEENSAILGRNLLRTLMMGQFASWTNLISWNVFKAVFLGRDHQLIKGFRLAFQQGFNHVFTQLHNQDLTEQQRNQAQLFINNCLMIFTYADPSPYESIAVPQWLDGQWQMVDYKVTPIELTPTSGFEKLFLSEDDRVFAYGLEPIHQVNAEPHLLFMGTTYPAGQGFVSTIYTDLEAFETAGKRLFRTGHGNITRWLDRQSQKVHVAGTSLGGGLSLLLAIDQGDKLSRVDALNPPGLHQPWFRKSRFDHWDDLVEKPEVFVQRQGNDFVSSFGVWKPDWTLLHVEPSDEQEGLNRIIDHNANYAGLPGTKVMVLDTEEDNQQRQRRNLWTYTILRSSFYYTVLVPFRYLALPLIRTITNNKLQVAFLAPLVALFIVLSPFAFSATMLSVGIISLVCVSYSLAQMVKFIADKLTHTNRSGFANIGHPILQFAGLVPIAAATVVLTLGLFSPLIVPLLTTFALVAVAGAALTVYIGYRLGKMVQTLLGFNKESAPACHDPELPRNALLDLYTNQAQEEFTYQQIHDYYQAKRCVLQDKEFLPQETRSHLFFSTGEAQKTKREVLEVNLESTRGDEKITCTASKAKLHDIKQTLQLVSQIGFHAPMSLKEELIKNRQDYLTGKPSRSVGFSSEV